MENFEITVVRNKEKLKETDWVTEEIPLTIDLNGKELVTLLTSPLDLKELVYGFLYASGLIVSADSIKNLVVDKERWRATVVSDSPNMVDELTYKRLYTSGCGKGIIYYNALDLMHRQKNLTMLTFRAEKVVALMKELQRGSLEFKKTGAVHSAALCNQEQIIILKDDIGRHNAVDKVIGEAILNNITFQDKLMLSTGRISSEILLKINRCRIPVLASLGAPTNQAVKMARDLNLTLIGFVRGSRMNIYNAEERIT